MRARIIILLAFIYACFFINGCGSSNNGVDSTDTTTQAATKSVGMLIASTTTKAKVYLGAGDDSFLVASSGTSDLSFLGQYAWYSLTLIASPIR